VILCRCEEVTLDDLRQAHEAGFATPELLKRATRIMMGPCQGRMCRTSFVRACDALLPRRDAAAGVLARDSAASLRDHHGRDVPGVRPPVRPLTLGDLASLDRFAPEPPAETKPRRTREADDSPR
jgi:hypothetical protein